VMRLLSTSIRSAFAGATAAASSANAIFGV
jgi:hypothetical protein